ncbi:sigma factor-like helix-turn-helix DNA-binding protein [Mesorhizobium sp. B2-3-12]|uniref:sigma factor-like helix-turn-helix DNA-binding protein n=1 Tax=Mesorhizobium sp. B2-3-12 TaxID=2589952 RepID=UPI0011282990|nr:sigma factor-like helix-turn-helix DNA-binding protein [Mesorhizobium sp. B2-3-12]TPL87248.1 RNA polymerase sigma factor [Mesorhizobium sp. B2-3-12]
MTEHHSDLNASGPVLAEQTQPATYPGGLSLPGSGEQTNLVDLVPALRAFARSLSGSIDEADNLVRETLIKGIADLDGVDGGRVKPWIFATMRRASLARLEDMDSQSRGRASCLSEPFASEALEQMGTGPGIARAIDLLADQERQAIVLVCMLGLSYEDAADICDCDTATIKGRIQDARTRMVVQSGAPAEATPEQSNG